MMSIVLIIGTICQQASGWFNADKVLSQQTAQKGQLTRNYYDYVINNTK